MNMKNYFDFREALDCLKSGMSVCITLNNTTRRYFVNDRGELLCTPNNKEYLTHPVNVMYLDAIMSDKWELYDD